MTAPRSAQFAFQAFNGSTGHGEQPVRGSVSDTR